ncbi:TIGR04540 family protein [Bacillus pacificus]
MKLFYKTQRELALSINKMVDAYWNDELNEEAFIRNVRSLYKNNPEKMIKRMHLLRFLNNNVVKEDSK